MAVGLDHRIVSRDRPARRPMRVIAKIDLSLRARRFQRGPRIQRLYPALGKIAQEKIVFRFSSGIPRPPREVVLIDGGRIGGDGHKKRDAPPSESPANALQKVGGFSDLSIPPHAAYALLHHLIAKIKHPPTPADQNGWRPGNRVGRIPIQMDHRLPEAEMIRQISVEDPGKPKPVGERAQPWRRPWPAPFLQ